MIGKAHFGYNTDVPRPDPLEIEVLSRYDTTLVADAQSRLGCMDVGIKPLSEEMRMTGPAVTVDLPANDNLMLYQALSIAKPGDVLVVSTGGNQTRAVWGELMNLSAQKIGIGGLVIDGMIRDVLAIRRHPLPVFCRGMVPANVFKRGPGFVNGTLSCGGVTVCAGDIIVGDADGVVVVCRQQLERIVEKAERLAQKEQERRREIESGQIFPRWLTGQLRAHGLDENAL